MCLRQKFHFNHFTMIIRKKSNVLAMLAYCKYIVKVNRAGKYTSWTAF